MAVSAAALEETQDCNTFGPGAMVANAVFTGRVYNITNALRLQCFPVNKMGNVKLL
jgi:hypothetical protein